MKKISLLLMSVLVAFGISAQELQNVSHGDVYLKNKASSNWFMSLAGGTNMYFGSGSTDQDFVDALGWQGQLAIGKWVSPNWGGRLAINVGQHEHYNTANDYTTDSFVHPHLDLMWNVTNAAVGYRADRVYNFIPYLGVGYIYGMDEDFKKVNPDGDLFKDQNQSLTWNLGIINDFRLSNNFSIFVELAATVLDGSFGRHYSKY